MNDGHKVYTILHNECDIQCGMARNRGTGEERKERNRIRRIERQYRWKEVRGDRICLVTALQNYITDRTEGIT